MAVLTEERVESISDILIKNGVLDAPTLQESIEAAKQKNVSLFTYLESEKGVPNEEIVRATAIVNGKKYVNLLNVHIDQNLLNRLPYDVALRMMAAPISLTPSGTLQIAVLDPDNLQQEDILVAAVRQPVELIMASQSGIDNILKQYNLSITSDVADINTEESKTDDNNAKMPSVDVELQNSPVSQIIDKLLDFAVRQKASDIHIEPTKNEVRVRCRMDGVLRKVTSLPKDLESAIVSRIKILANLRIDEHRRPQDGQFTIVINNLEVDLRVAVSPEIWGEKVVMRLLRKDAISLNLEAMGMRGNALKTVRASLARSSGLILVSGPTGSGKTTTLYALLNEIMSEKINIVTLEDPVEYKIEGINQIQVDVTAGLTFANGLRSILRQDPDVILVGEIRDDETAGLAVQAALTGHLVLATIHTNSAVGILPRLKDMGVEPFLVAATLNLALAQRLIRKNVKNKESYVSSKAEADAINNIIGNILPTTEEERIRVEHDTGYENLPLRSDSYTLWSGIKDANNPEGFSGRQGIFEVIDISKEIQDLISSGASDNRIEEVVAQQGVLTMQQDGYFKVLNGDTTIEEVNRVSNIVV